MVQYVLAGVLVILAALIRVALSPVLGYEAPTLLFVAPPVLAANFGRIGPSLFATACSALVVGYLFLEPIRGFWPMSAADRTKLEIFVIQSAILGALVASLQRARYRAAEAAEEAAGNARFVEAIVAGTPHAVIAADPDGIVTAWNPAAERMFGWTAAEAIGVRTRTVPPSEHEAFAAMLQRTLSGETAEGVQALRRRKDGQDILCDISLAPLRDSAGVITGVVATITDISRLRSLEEQLRQSQKMEAVGELTAGIAHDFNNQLTAIRGYAQLAQYALPPDHQLQPDLREIDRAAESAASLTRQLLEFSRRRPLELRPVDLAQVVADSGKLIRRTLPESITIHTQISPEPSWIVADPGQLQHVLLNLVVNARDALPNGGAVRIETTVATLEEPFDDGRFQVPRGHYVVLSVSDTGIGMEPHVLARIFEPFFTTKGSGRGTGLGLPMVFSTVRQMRGSMGVHSEPGRGATFKMYFPRVTAAGEPIPAARHAPASGGHERVLLVDDEPGIRALAARTLTRAGYLVEQADGAASALALARGAQAPFDLLVTDVVMPGMNGPSLAQLLVGQYGLKRVLYTSGYTNQPELEEQITRGAVQFLGKPFTPVELCDSVRKALDARALG